VSLSSAFPLRTLHPSRRPELDAIEVISCVLFSRVREHSFGRTKVHLLCLHLSTSLRPVRVLRAECLSRSRKL
jgi:hypothetical protein